MPGRDAFGETLIEVLAPLGPVQIRRMFGGSGIFLDGLMFGLVADDVLYFKSDAETTPAYEAEGLAPFRYARSDGRVTVMSYWQAPERLLDEPDEMVAWARKALDAARRAARKPKPIQRASDGRRQR
jgi:DNA transformation protein